MADQAGLTDCTLTIRVIKSFPYRTVKNCILHHLDLTKVTVGELKDLVKNEMKTKPGWKPYHNVALDTIKLYTKAMGTKTQNLIINLEDDESKFFSDDSKVLSEYGCEHETELSYFNREAYDEFKKNPEEKWT